MTVGRLDRSTVILPVCCHHALLMHQWLRLGIALLLSLLVVVSGAVWLIHT